MAGSRTRRLVRLVGSVVVGVSVTGCYTLNPVTGAAPTNGTQIALDVTDAGRAALGGALGPEVAQIEGRLFSRDSAEFVVSVSTVHLLRGGEQVWSGEKVHVRAEHVSRVYERELSRSRSVVLSALGAGALVYLVTRSILGAGQSEVGKLPSDTSHSFGRRFARP